MITGLSYLFASVTVAIVLGIASRQRHDARNGIDTYFYPPAVLWTLAFLAPLPGVLGTLLYATWPPAQKPTGVGLVALWAISGGVILAFLCVYWKARAYRVELTDRELSITTWLSSRRITLDDVADTNVFDGRTYGGGTRRLAIYFRDGSSITIPGLLTDFDDLVGALQAKTMRATEGAIPGEEKVKDLERLARNKSRENLLAYTGIAIIAIVSIIIWKLS
jgi:hypothetical protein